jgi:hypothetical protein
VFWLLLGLTACGGAGKVTANGPAYPERSVASARTPGAPPPSTPVNTSSSTSPASSTKPSPTAPASPASPGFGEAPFSTASATLIEQANRDARWVALCRVQSDESKTATTNADHREAVERVLITPKEELDIDAWLGASPNGRYLLLLQSGALTLWDSETRTSVDLSALGADARLSAETNAHVRVLDFDAQSEHLLYVRRNANGSRAVLRTLSDGSERELDTGPGEIWRARFDPSSAFVTLQMISADSNRNGKLDFPAPLLAAPPPCGDDLVHFRIWEGRGDRAETVLLPLSGSAPIHEPNLVISIADARLLRDENGALLLERAGKKRVLEPAECKGRIVYADALRELFIVGCAQKKKTGHVSLELVTREGRKPLDLELASVELDRDVGDSARLIALYPGADTLLFDADRNELIKLQPGDSVLATVRSRALIRRGNALFFYDADTRSESALPGQLDKYPDIFRALPFVFISPLLIDLDTAQVVGVTKRRPLALSAGGQLLIGETDADGPSWARGPLRWLTPAPLTP